MDEFQWKEVRGKYNIPPTYNSMLLSVLLEDRSPRTLMMGLNVDSTYQHTYTDDGIVLTTLCYGRSYDLHSPTYYELKYEYSTARITRAFLESTIPTGYAFPECCDREYVVKLLELCSRIEFNKFMPRARHLFHGLTSADFLG
jgi:hypothetical protein